MLKDILAITGKSGLFKLVASSPKVVIVESLADGKRGPLRTDNRVTSLADICIYSEDGEVQLKVVLRNMRENAGGKAVISHKEDDDKIRSVFAKALPNYDRERVYLSDMRKVLLWYNQLLAAEMLSLIDEADDASETSETEETAEEAPVAKESSAAKESPKGTKATEAKGSSEAGKEVKSKAKESAKAEKESKSEKATKAEKSEKPKKGGKSN